MKNRKEKEEGDNLVKQRKTKKRANVNLRFNVLTILIYIVGIILIVKLFSLQIIHGAEYREKVH